MLDVLDKKYYFFRIFLITICCICFSNLYSQIDSTVSLTFDFNEHQIKEKNNLIIPKYLGVTLTNDRFGNEKSAAYLHGNISSYLNLGTSPLLKPINGTISLWVNLDRRVYAGKGYDSNPIIVTKNAEGEDFVLAFCIIYDCYSKKLLACSTKDSLKESIIVAENKFDFGKWYHLAITQDSSYFSFYINGKLQQRANKNFNTKYLSSDSVVIGHTASKKNERYSIGEFDDIQIFHRVLSDKEINDLYESPNPNKFKNIISEAFKYLIIILILIFIIIFILIRNQRKLKKQKEQFELLHKIKELELKVVKAQMNPHFISNCLAAIQELIYKNDVDKAGQYLAKFSYFLRQILHYSNKNFITIAEEIEVIKINIELEQLRFKNKFDFILTIDESIDIDEVLIPALITQPFIENAIWHGLLPSANSINSKLEIKFLLRDGLPIIEIEDNGIGRDLNKLSNENSKGTKLIINKIDSLNKLSKTLKNNLQIIDLLDINQDKIGTKIIIQLEDI